MLRFEPTRYHADDGDVVYVVSLVIGTWDAYTVRADDYALLGTFDSSAEAIDACDQHNRAQKGGEK